LKEASGAEVVRYPIRWRLIWRLIPAIAVGGGARFDILCREIAGHVARPPVIAGEENLPSSPRFLLAANHYQRRGLWIVHPAAIITDVLRRHYRLDNPPVRWIVTANWPPVRIGRFSFASPGDWLLPRIARALLAYPVPFAGANPQRAARSLRRLVRDAATTERPIGLFPEGVSGTAERPAPPLPGVERLIAHLARVGLPVVPVSIAEQYGIVVRFRRSLPPAELLDAGNCADLVLARIRESGPN
jgi:1-acyl-sn-glycerol-3-phosphate acyltransferase